MSSIQSQITQDAGVQVLISNVSSEDNTPIDHPLARDDMFLGLSDDAVPTEAEAKPA